MNLNKLFVASLFTILISGIPFMFFVYEVQAGFPGANGKIVFMSKLDLLINYEIYTVEPDGSGQTRITFNRGTNPAWSPDGSKIAFERNDHIYIMNADGSGATQVTSSTDYNDEPSWSPDGTKIAFAASTSEFDPSDIYVINTDGSGLTQLTSDSLYDFGPVWSPDGSKIAFSREPEGDVLEIFVMNSDGTGVTQLTDNDMTDDFPSWSPDGSKIAFSSIVSGTTEIRVMNADGSGLIQLTDNSFNDFMPSWSPDGEKIAFASTRDGDSVYDIFIMNNDGSNVMRATSNNAHDIGPDWQAIEPSPPPTTYTIIIDTIPANLGNITFNGTIYIDGDDISREAGSYNITANPETNYTFVRWESDGGVIVSNALSSTTMCTISANGTLRMVQETVTPTLFVIVFDTEPTSMGSITFDGVSYSDGENVSKAAGIYIIAANPAIGYAFSRWETFGLITVSNITSSSINCTVNGLGTVKLVQTEITTPPPTTPTPPPSGCLIVTASHGSELAPEVIFMRHVRDDVIGSNDVGMVLVSVWNNFYYSWSPPVANMISNSKTLQSTFRILLLPLVAIIHVTAFVHNMFSVINPSFASVIAFNFAALSTVMIYIGMVLLILLMILHTYYPHITGKNKQQ